MNISLVAERYAGALLELAIEKNALEEVYNDNLLITGTCDACKELVLLLNSPVINTEKKEIILRKIFEGHVGRLTLTYLQIMVRKKREALIPAIAKKLTDLYNEYKNILSVQFKAPVLPDEELKKSVLELMARYTGKTIDLNPEIDESLIGGFVLSWEDKQYDASIRREIENMKNTIARINLYKKRI